jgi:hypothetical protein
MVHPRYQRDGYIVVMNWRCDDDMVGTEDLAVRGRGLPLCNEARVMVREME